MQYNLSFKINRQTHFHGCTESLEKVALEVWIERERNIPECFILWMGLIHISECLEPALLCIRVWFFLAYLLPLCV